MPVHRGNILGVILDAWTNAHACLVDGHSTKETNQKRSKNWICSLARQFEKEYAGERHRVFWSGNKDYRDDFKRNEFLFDIAVCSVSETKSLQTKPKDLRFIAQCHWQIESEFHRANTREIVIDMSKLVMGSAENKLLIASHRSDEQEKKLLEQCSKIASYCSGHPYFCFVSHPNDWGDPCVSSPALYEWLAGGWVGIQLPEG